MKKVLTTIAVSLSALIASSAMAAPQHDPRFNHKAPPPAHWNNNDHRNNDYKWQDNNRYQQKRVNPSRDWRVGQTLPRSYDSSRYKVDYRDTKKLSKPNRNQEWYKINGDYVLVNEKNNKIVRIIG